MKTKPTFPKLRPRKEKPTPVEHTGNAVEEPQESIPDDTPAEVPAESLPEASPEVQPEEQTEPEEVPHVLDKPSFQEYYASLMDKKRIKSRKKRR